MSFFKHSLIASAVLATALAAGTANAFPVDVVITDKPVRSIEIGDFWIGLACGEVDDALRAHIDLPEGVGIIVRNVFPGSAGEEAGVQQHDIVVKAGKTDLKTPMDLIEAVKKSKAEVIKLQLIRKGKEHAVEVTPKKRPAEHRIIQFADRKFTDSVIGENRHKVLEQLLKRPNDMRVWTVGPGVVLPKTWVHQGVLPKGVTVSVTRKNDEPAQIKVTRGEETWEITEKEIDKLPAELRPGVQSMISQPSTPWRVRFPNAETKVYQYRKTDKSGNELRPSVVTRVESHVTKKTENKTTDKQDQDIELKSLAEEIRKLSEKIEKLERSRKK